MKTQTNGAAKPAPNEVVQKLALAKCHISANNTRQPTAKEVTASGLVKSLETRGQSTPAIARPFPGKPGHVELAAGARRRVGCEAAKIATLDVIVRDMTDDEFEELILVENLQREDPDPKAEAKLLQKLVARGIATAEAISAHLGKPKTWAVRRLKLLAIVPAVLKQWEKGHFAHFTVEMIELIGSLPAELQGQLVANENIYSVRQCRTRADLNNWIEQNQTCDLDEAPFDLNDPRFFVKNCGPGCACSSVAQPGLFDFEGRKGGCGQCLKPECFNARVALYNADQVKTLSAGEDLPIVTTGYLRGGIQIGKQEIEPTQIQEHQTTVHKKPVEGAKKVILTDGTKFTVAWIESKNKGAGASKKLASPIAKMTDKRNALQARRWNLVLTDLQGALAKSVHNSVSIRDIDKLVAVFGLPYAPEPKRGGKRTLWSDLDSGEYELYPHEYGKHTYTKNRAEMLWSGLRVVLKKQLGGFHKVGDLIGVVPDLERVATLISFPLAAKKLEADAKIPAPKTWGTVDQHTLMPVTTVATKPSTKSAKEKTK